MQEPSIPHDEAQRIATLIGLNILDTPAEERFDRITRIAMDLFEVPIALVSLIDTDRQWFKSCQGLSVSETPRSISFCGHAILSNEAFIIEDTHLDVRFADNPLVTQAPHIRFYAGQPLKARNGSRLGTLCVIDRVPRKLTLQQLKSLKDLAAMTESELDLLDIHTVNNALLDHKNRLRAILDNIIDGIITINETGMIESFNSSAEDIFGYAAEEVIGKNVNILMPEPYHGQHDNYLRNYSSTGIKKIIGSGREVSGRRKNGSTFPMDLAVSEMLIGSQRMFTGIVRDISRRKNAEESLASTSRLNQAILNSAEHMIIATASDGTILTFNRAAERALGYSAAELEGKHSPAKFHDIEEIILRARQLNIEGYDVEPGFDVFVVKARQGKSDINEWSYISKDGRRFPVILAVTSLKNDQGEITGFLGVGRDISAQKKAEMALLETTLSLARAQKIAHIGNWSWEIESNELHWSEETVRIFGLPSNQSGGKFEAFIETVHPADREKLQQAVKEACNGKNFNIDHRIILPDGSEKFVNEQGEVEFDPAGKACRMIGTVQDITERKLVERMKTEFISTVSHELRTPLTSIRGSLGLLMGGVAGELHAQAKSLIDIAYKNSERLILLVNDILDMEKIESGKMNFNMLAVDLVPLIQQSLIANRAYGEQHKVSFVFEDCEHLPMVSLDSDRFMQILANFLSNAAKFSPEGSVVSVHVKVKNGHVRVNVTDLGSGISAAYASKVFQKFSQADSSDTRSKGGTGLGLSITKALVESMGGNIGFTSKPGSGSTFYVEFPAIEEYLNTTQGPLLTAAKAQNKKRILICEDDRDVAKLLKMMLEQDGYQSDIAYSAAEAKASLKQTAYQAITLDIMLPGQDGLSFLREIQADKKTQAIPVIIVSASASEHGDDLENGLIVMDWISKPIDENRLMSSLHRITSDTHKPVILHVEDDVDICQVLRTLIGNEGLVIAVHTLEDARNKLESTAVDLIILDLGLPDGSGLELLSFMNIKGIEVPVIIFSASEFDTDIARQVKATLIKSRTSNEQLLARIKQIIE